MLLRNKIKHQHGIYLLIRLLCVCVCVCVCVCAVYLSPLPLPGTQKEWAMEEVARDFVIDKLSYSFCLHVYAHTMKMQKLIALDKNSAGILLQYLYKT